MKPIFIASILAALSTNVLAYSGLTAVNLSIDNQASVPFTLNIAAYNFTSPSTAPITLAANKTTNYALEVPNPSSIGVASFTLSHYNKAVNALAACTAQVIFNKSPYTTSAHFMQTNGSVRCNLTKTLTASGMNIAITINSTHKSTIGYIQ